MERETVDVVKAKLDRKEYRLLKRDGLSSKVWDKFHLVVNETNSSVGYASCADCSALLTFTSGTTHLNKHVCKPWRDKSLRTLPPDIKQIIMQKCVNMCVKDFHPINIIIGDGFKELGQELIKVGAQYGNINIADIMPHSITVSRQIKGHADEIRNKLMPQVKTAIENNACACTVDMWTDCYNQLHYLTLTSHILNSTFTLISYALFTTKLPCTVTAENIRAEIESNLAEENIFPEQMQKIVFVSNQSTSIKNALEKYKHYTCAAHCLNAILIHTFNEQTFLSSNAPEVMKILAAARIITSIMKNIGLGYNLTDTLKQETPTRWNSMYKMLNSLQQHYGQVVEILHEKNMQDKLQGYDYQLAGKLLIFLKHFKEAVDDLEKENEPTIQAVLLWFHKLKGICLSSDNDCEELKKIKQRALEFLVDKMEIRTVYKVATFLWPTFRHLAMLTDVEREQVYKYVRQLCGNVRVNTDLSEMMPSPPKKRDRFKEWQAAAVSTRNEVDVYLQMDVGDDEDLLNWWHLQEHKLPSLFRVAQHVLCIPATSALSERNFSKTGVLLTSRSNQLDPDRINDLLVVHNSYRSMTANETTN